jgi:hypothetical protein
MGKNKGAANSNAQRRSGIKRKQDSAEQDHEPSNQEKKQVGI